MPVSPRFARIALVAALLSAPPFALAQTAPAADNKAGRTYTPEDFARYSPRNALAMLEQVPGFVIREAVEERGLGQATGNVLLNGRRMSASS